MQPRGAAHQNIERVDRVRLGCVRYAAWHSYVLFYVAPLFIGPADLLLFISSHLLPSFFSCCGHFFLLILKETTQQQYSIVIWTNKCKQTQTGAHRDPTLSLVFSQFHKKKCFFEEIDTERSLAYTITGIGATLTVAHVKL